MRRTIAVVQPYLAQYQLPFFELSHERLLEQDISLEILAGSPPASRRDRQDQARLGYSHDIPVLRVPAAALKFDFQASWLSRCSSPPSAVILEQATRHVDTYMHLLKSRFGGPAVAFWGHGKAYHRVESKFFRGWRKGMTNSGSWFFAYTAEGAESAIGSGFPGEQVTVLNNATDTRSLRRAIDGITAEELHRFMESHGLSDSNTAIFVGGIDESKGIQTLIEVCGIVSRRNPQFRCLVIGAGSLEGIVTSPEAISSGITYLGRLDGETKALALSAADFAIIPREVGLVAVDTLAAGIPILTQADACHGPEFSYLLEGSSVHTSEAGAESLALLVLKVLSRRDSGQGTMFASNPPIEHLTIEQMSMNFCDGVSRWLSLIDRQAIGGQRST